MIVTAITSFTTTLPTDSIIGQLSQAINSLSEKPHFVIGTKVQSLSIIQITSEWPSFQAPSALTASPAYQTFNNTISNIASSPVTTTIALLSKSVFADGTPPLVEYVISSFSASPTTEFQAKIEDDFARFESIYRKRGMPEDVGELGLATGWAEEKDGVRAFVVVRGWTRMERFREAVESEEFKGSIGILMGWGVPFELWHVERRAGGEGV